MNPEKILIRLEMYLILLPVTVIAIPGLTYLLITPLGDIPYVQAENYVIKMLRISFYEVITILSIGAMYSIWVALKRLKNTNTAFAISERPFLYSFIAAGMIISLLAALEAVSPAVLSHPINRILQQRENYAVFSLYYFGLPVCIPATHVLVRSLTPQR